MNRQLLAAILLSTATAATAAPATLELSGGPDNFTAHIHINPSAAGAFEDWFYIDFPGMAEVNGQLSSIFQSQNQSQHQVVFTEVELDGHELDIGGHSIPNGNSGHSRITNYAKLLTVTTDGGFLLRVAGCAGPCDDSTTRTRGFSASYSGTLNLRRINAPAQDVPEPATLALVLAALGGAGLAGRHRAKARKRVA